MYPSTRNTIFWLSGTENSGAKATVFPEAAGTRHTEEEPGREAATSLGCVPEELGTQARSGKSQVGSFYLGSLDVCGLLLMVKPVSHSQKKSTSEFLCGSSLCELLSEKYV